MKRGFASYLSLVMGRFPFPRLSSIGPFRSTSGRRSSVVLALCVLLATGCQTVPSSQGDRSELADRAQSAVRAFKASDPSMQTGFFDTAVAYAVLPSVRKGAAGYGGAFGRGIVFENGAMVGYCSMTQGTVGIQLGGQVYKEIIFFKDKAAFAEFKRNDLAFSAQASAVAATADAAANADYSDGVAVFTIDSKGLMFEASVGGQKFEYVPASEIE